MHGKDWMNDVHATHFTVYSGCEHWTKSLFENNFFLCILLRMFFFNIFVHFYSENFSFNFLLLQIKNTTNVFIFVLFFMGFVFFCGVVVTAEVLFLLVFETQIKCSNYWCHHEFYGLEINTAISMNPTTKWKKRC